MTEQGLQEPKLLSLPKQEGFILLIVWSINLSDRSSLDTQFVVNIENDVQLCFVQPQPQSAVRLSSVQVYNVHNVNDVDKDFLPQLIRFRLEINASKSLELILRYQFVRHTILNL